MKSAENKIFDILEVIQDNVITLQNNMDNMQDNMNKMQSNIYEMQNDISNMKSDIQTMQNDIQTIKKDNEESKEEILDRFFIFEEEYGKKINGIYDAVLLEQEKNIEKSKKIQKIDNRLDKAENNILYHDKRLSFLENKIN